MVYVIYTLLETKFKHVLLTWNSAFLGNCAYMYIPYLLAAPTYYWPTGRSQTRVFVSESETSTTFMVSINRREYKFPRSGPNQCASFSIMPSVRGIFKFQINGCLYTHHALIYLYALAITLATCEHSSALSDLQLS